MTSIEYYALANCQELTDVYCYAENVPSANVHAFRDSYIEYATLYVPASAIEQYKGTAPWNNFGTIVTLTDEDAIKDVKASGEVVEMDRYDIQGRRLFAPQKGINIIRYSDGSTRKVMVK